MAVSYHRTATLVYKLQRINIRCYSSRMEAITQATNRLHRVYNVVKFDELGINMSWKIPGFMPSDFDRRGKLCPWTVLKNLEVPRIGMNSPVMPKDKIGMLVATAATFNKSYYDHATAFVMPEPLIVVFNIAHVGKSSLAYRCTVSMEQRAANSITSSMPSNDQSIELLSAIWHMVFIDKNTLRPAVLMAEEAETLKKVSVPHSVERIEIPAKPVDGCHRTEMRAGFSDLDHLQHVNVFGLYRYALNGIDCAAQEGYFKPDFPDDDRNIRTIFSQNIKEVFAGEFLQAYSWKIDSNVVCCQLERDNVPVAKFLVSYY